jgi:hypothetical protein
MCTSIFELTIMRWNVQGSRSRPNMSLKQGDGIFIKQKMCVVVCPTPDFLLTNHLPHGLHPPLEEHPPSTSTSSLLLPGEPARHQSERKILLDLNPPLPFSFLCLPLNLYLTPDFVLLAELASFIDPVVRSNIC